MYPKCAPATTGGKKATTHKQTKKQYLQAERDGQKEREREREAETTKDRERENVIVPGNTDKVLHHLLTKWTRILSLQPLTNTSRMKAMFLITW